MSFEKLERLGMAMQLRLLRIYCLPLLDKSVAVILPLCSLYGSAY